MAYSFANIVLTGDSHEETGQGAPRFPIVAVGASAGGLAAITQLLRGLGDAPGLAVIVIQHLDPARASSLVELLARVTPLPVAEVRGGALVEVDHVYVIPPGADMMIEHGVLQLSPRSHASVPHLPIDLFFTSLAEECGTRAIGVVLSGTGSDATRGVQAIKAEGGITFAQEGAEHAGMPESAIATRCVDFVLTAERVADELLRIAARGPDDAAEDDEPFRRILSALKVASGVDFAPYKPATLRRRMLRRAALRNVGGLYEYATVVAAEPAEVAALSEDVLIHVTSFFRDPEVFTALEKEVFPRLVASRGAAPIRVWVAGCSTGEETYSLAISLLGFLAEAGISHIPVKMFGTDVSPRAIARARAGIYPESIAGDVTPARLARFFQKSDRGYEILKDVRDRCVFATHDVTRDPPFSNMDLISCRNLMIYLGPALQLRVLPTFHYALGDPGFLVLGPAETVGPFLGFTALDPRNRIYTRAPGRTRFAFDSPEIHGWPMAHAGARAPDRATTGADLRKDADRAFLSVFAPAGVVVTNELAIVEFRGDLAPYLELAPGAATLDLLRMVRTELRPAVRRTVDEARVTGKPTRCADVGVGSGESRRSVDVNVVPFDTSPASARFFALLFREHPAASKAAVGALERGSERSAVEESLRGQLASTGQYLQSVIEKLEAGNEDARAANEEILSSNEELQSTNEELQTAKEELQATNEELRTVNDEMIERNVESTRLANDLSNVLSSVAIPIVILGVDSTIRRFTPAATKILNLIATDIGRPITDLRPKVAIPELTTLIAEVLENLAPLERTVRTEGGDWYQLVVRPYRTIDNRIDGTVLSIYDIDTLKRAEGKQMETQLALTEAGFREMLLAAPEGLLMSDSDGRLVFANEMASGMFGYTKEEMLALRVEDLLFDCPPAPSARPRGPLATPAPPPLRDQDLVGRRKGGTQFPVEVSLTSMDAREGALRVAFVSDVSVRREAERRIRDYHRRLQQMAFAATKAEDRERRRIAQDLHDGVGQSLTLSRIKLEEARGSSAGPLHDLIATASDLTATALAGIRTLTFELAPPILYDLGLKAALSWLALDVEKRLGLHVEIEDDGAAAPSDTTMAPVLFRAVGELLANVFKHARVSSALIALAKVGDRYEIRIEDGGVGFNPEKVLRGGGTGFGLFSVREQIARLGGTVDLLSSSLQGTRVILRVPIARQDEAPDSSDRGGT